MLQTPVMSARSDLGVQSLFSFPPSLSRYRPLAQIGRGGMAEIVLTEWQRGAEPARLAVLRRMWPDLVPDPARLTLFLQEGRLTERMSHPHVAETHELVEDAERPAIAMEYLEGQPLVQVLSRLVGSNTLGLTLRLRILANVLAALNYAHTLTDDDGVPRGLLHRDVNPRNVFVTYAGQTKLLGFGRAHGPAGEARTPLASLGNMAYMAPEQLSGEPVGPEADVFAVGVMLWEMVARRRLWEGMTDAAIFKHLSSRIPVPPLPTHGHLPSSLTKICARALAQEPGGRYASAAEFAFALEELLPPNNDVQARHLGKVVSLAFAAEREARRALIHATRSRGSAPTWLPTVASASVAAPPLPAAGFPWPRGVDGPSAEPRKRDPRAPAAEVNRAPRFGAGRSSWALAGFALAVLAMAAGLAGASLMQRLTPLPATREDGQAAAPVVVAPAVVPTSGTSKPEPLATPQLASLPSSPGAIAEARAEPCCSAGQGSVGEPRISRHDRHSKRPSQLDHADEGGRGRLPDTDDVMAPSTDFAGASPTKEPPPARAPAPAPALASTPASPIALRPIDVADPFNQP